MGGVNIQFNQGTGTYINSVWSSGTQAISSSNSMQQPQCSGNTCWFEFNWLPVGTVISGIRAGWKCKPGSGLGGGTPIHFGPAFSYTIT